MDTFIVFHAKDIAVLGPAIAGLQNFLRPVPSRVVLVSAPLPPSLKVLFTRPGIEFVDESEVIPDLSRSAMPVIRDRAVLTAPDGIFSNS